MAAKIVPIYFAPDVDNAWSVAPGALASMNAFAPLQSGAYGSIGTANFFGSSTLTGTSILGAKTFRQIDGTVRFLVFRPADIDEYDSSATKTNRGTGYANTNGMIWSSAAWGNQIIACNGLDATQSSTSGAFSALAGAPKAKYVAANLDFVMLASVDDGGSNVYSDMVWWSGLRNPATWTPALSTQCGNVRLLDVPGPIRQVVAYRDTFVVFKDDAFWVGEYVGPPPQGYIFNWRLVSAKIGCVAPQSVCELDGRLYFVHSSGVYEFDGQNLRNIGIPVFHSMLNESGYAVVTGPVIGAFSPATQTAETLFYMQAAVDDLEGVVWFRTSVQNTATAAQTLVLYGYNSRSQKWGRHVVTGTGVGARSYPRLVATTYSDIQAFKADTTGRIWMIWADGSSTTMRSVKYPYGATDQTVPAYTTGVFGSVDGSDKITRHYWRTLYGTEANAANGFTINGYTNENKLLTNGTANGTINSEFDDGNVSLSARFKTVDMTFSTAKIVLLGGIGFDGSAGGSR